MRLDSEIVPGKVLTVLPEDEVNLSPENLHENIKSIYTIQITSSNC